MDKIRGVNLGGWLVLEKWMTPTIFKGTDAQDQLEFMKTPGALKKLRQHQDSFITEEDFAWLAKNRINMVRVPVGYWIISGDPPLASSIGKLDWAIEMAKRYGIKVLIDLHGAPGGQNGLDHSGVKGSADWYKRSEHRQATIDILVALAKRYRSESTVWGIELLNEPKPVLGSYLKLKRFYRQSYQAIKQVARPGLCVVFHDSFRPRLFSGIIKPDSNFPIYLDHHWYNFFLPKPLLNRLSPEAYKRILKLKIHTLKRLSRKQPVIIGEWNGVLPGECLGKIPTEQHDTIIRDNIVQQQATYQYVAGDFYWNYKTEDRGVWHFRSMVEDGQLLIK